MLQKEAVLKKWETLACKESMDKMFELYAKFLKSSFAHYGERTECSTFDLVNAVEGLYFAVARVKGEQAAAEMVRDFVVSASELLNNTVEKYFSDGKSVDVGEYLCAVDCMSRLCFKLMRASAKKENTEQ